MPDSPEVAVYNIRNFRTDLRDRIRVLAALRNIPMEQVTNEAVEAGLPILEAQVPAIKKLQK